MWRLITRASYTCSEMVEAMAFHMYRTQRAKGTLYFHRKCKIRYGDRLWSEIHTVSFQTSTTDVVRLGGCVWEDKG